MGGGTFTSANWSSYTDSKAKKMGAVSYASLDHGQIFEQRHISPNLDPKGVSVRESRDSSDNPNSTPLIIGLDVTGSMHAVLTKMAKEGLEKLMVEMYGRKPITDPHVMMLGIGDAEAGDQAPLQATQFEADIRIGQQLEQVWLEQGGGGNHYESYILAWYFAAYHTAIDSFEKRGKKGYLITVGDEEPTPYLRPADIKRVLGYTPPSGRDLTAAGLLAAASEKWEVFHMIVAEGSYARQHPDLVKTKWANLLGQRALWLPKHDRLAEVAVSTLQLANGLSYDEIAASWDKTTAAAVAATLNRGINFSGVPTA